MPRRKNDFYPTPSWATRELLKRLPSLLHKTVVEPCAGAGDISNVLAETGCRLLTADIDPQWGHKVQDAREIIDPCDWVITNPPFSSALQIVEQSYEQACDGIAMLLRLSFLEPTYRRQGFLVRHPPDRLIVLPRISFTGDGKTDSVTCAWMIWDFHDIPAPCRSIIIIPKSRDP